MQNKNPILSFLNLDNRIFMMKKKTNLKNLLFLLWLLIFQILCLNATKHTYKDLQPCEECEENSKLFYEIKKI